MDFDTAIFYDIENLIGGYAKAEMLPSLSLVDINQSVKKLNIGNVAIQRAYANWNTPRLNVLRDDIVTLGINPVQMFGFGRGADKNASDIQLVIDAIDIACNRPNIKNFVIVSGDGGFSPLAIKLHEYGKKVVGVGYKRITNRVLESVCDDFVWLYDPISQKPITITTTNNAARDKNQQQTPATPLFTDQVLINYAKKFEPLRKPSKERAISEGQEIIKFLAANDDVAIKLNSSGLNISILIQALKYRLGDLKYPTMGFIKQIDFVNFIVKDTTCKLVLKAPSEYRLAFKSARINGFTDVVPPEVLESLHSTTLYRDILATGKFPLIRLPEKIVTHDTINYLLKNRESFQTVNFVSICQQLEDNLTCQRSDIDKAVSALLLSAAFTHDGTVEDFHSREYSLVAADYTEAYQYLEDTMYEKLFLNLGEVDEEAFADLLLLEAEYQ